MDDGLGDVIVEIGNLLDQIVVSLLNNLDILLRHIGDFIRRSKLIVFRINDRLLIDDIELAAQLIFLAQRQQNRPRVRAEFFVDAIHRHLEVRADAVHFVDECQTRHVVLGRLTPDCFRLRLHAGHAIKNCDPPIENA